MTSIDRSKTVDFDPGAPKQGKIIHLDAKQRVVIQKDFGIICAEPSPDALSATAANLSGAVSTPASVEVALAGALAEAAGSIGLRTQSIQLMRDALYRVCELYFGRALNDSQVMMLHQKYQDVMVAILAIEQLTGAVVPKVVGLGTSAKGTALARSVDLGKAVRDAEARVAAAEEAVKVAKGNVSSAEDKKKLADDANAKAKAENGDADAQKDALTKVEAAAAELEDRNAKLKVAEETLGREKNTLEGYKQAEDAALADVRSEATGTATFGAGSTVTKVDKDTAEKISSAVKSIVEIVVHKNYALDAYMGMLADANDLKSVSRRVRETQHEFAIEADREKKEQLKVELDIAQQEQRIISTCLELIQTGLKNSIQAQAQPADSGVSSGETPRRQRKKKQ